MKILVILSYTNKKHQIYCLEKLNRRELYNIPCILKKEKFLLKNFVKNIFKLRFSMENYLYLTTVSNSWYKVSRAFSHISMLFHHCFCMKEPETSIHIFHTYTEVNILWPQLQLSLQYLLIIAPITPQGAIFGFTDHEAKFNLMNHFLIIFKYYVYKAYEYAGEYREYGRLELNIL